MEQAEDEGRRLCVGLEAEPALVGSHVVERLVDNGEADDRIQRRAKFMTHTCQKLVALLE